MMKLKPLWIRTFCLFSWIGVLLWSSLPVEAQSNQKADSTMRLLVQSLSRELKTLQQNVSSLNSLVAMQQKQHKIEIANLQKRVQQQQAALQDIKKKYKAEFAILQARLKKLKSRPAAIAKQPTPAVVKPAAGLQGAPSMGPANAKITIVEYSDFQCPFCTRGSKTIKQLMKDYKGKIRLVFRHFPLSFHKDAHLAAQASMAAHAQGKFWAYHDKLFGNNSSLRKPVLQRYAKELGLDMKKFNAALNSGKYKAYVDKDLAAASRAGANGTPTFLINKHKIVGAQPIENFKRVIDAMLAGKAVPSDAPAAPAKPTGPVKPNIKGAPSDGPANAKVTIVEFSDFQCPFCSRGSSIMKQVKKAYGNKVRLVFKHLPLNFHKDAHLAAQASMAAHAQGKFWAFHDKLFANNRNLKKADLQKYAKQLGLDMKKFNAALNSKKYKKYVDNDLTEAGRLGANGTPTFFINGISVVGAQPFARFKSMIDAALAGKPMPSAAPPAPPKPKGPVKLNTKGAPSNGPANAKVTIVAFSDFQCPFCTRGSSIMKQVKKAYGNKVRLVFKHLPLSFHKDAHLAAQASMAAHEQGKFWAFHDKLFDNNSNLKKADLQKYAKQLGLDMKKFNAALNSGKYKKYVDNDLAEAGRVGANGTPTFFINGVSLVGAQPFDRFKSMIDAALAGKPMPSADAAPQAPPKPTGPVKLNIKGAPADGPANAKVTIVEFSDFQCPFCTRGSSIMKQVKKAYGNKVRLVFKHLPLSFHQDAHLAAQASMAAHEQGKFWAFHDKLFANNSSLKKADLQKYAKQLGLDMKKFNAALNSGKYKKYVDNDRAEAGRAGADGTPTFFVNGKRLVGAQPFSSFKQMIDAALKK